MTPRPRNSRTWELSLDQMGGIHTTYPQLVSQLSFTSVKDYDDWIARLHALPKAFDQVTANLAIGIEDGRVPPKYLLEKALDQVKELAHQKPEDSPLALPLKSFPAAIKPAEPGAHQDGDAGRHRQGGAARLSALCPLPGGQLHSRRTRGTRRRRAARWCKVLSVPHPPNHHHQPDRRSRSIRSAWTRSSATRQRCSPLRRSSALPTSPASAPA